MRITNSIILRGYNRDLNRLKNMKNECEKRITSTRKFSRASEAPLSAAKALNVRKSLYYSEQYRENLNTANKFYTEAETSLLQVSDKMAQVRELLVAACNTTKDSQEYAIYSNQLETIARELVSVFNTDSAGRAIFGGESDDSMPFSLIEDSNGFLSTVLYHGVPVNAMNNYMGFPYSNPVTIDIGLGMYMDQKTQYTDPQSVLDISFNGAKITGCGADRGTADIDLSSIRPDRKYCIDVYANGIKKTIEFKGGADRTETIKNINLALKEAYKKEVAYDKLKLPQMDENGIIYSEGSLVSAVNNPNHPTADKLVVDNDAGYTDKCKLNFAALESGKMYSIDVTMGDITKSISFQASADPDPTKREDETIANLQAALDEAFGTYDEVNPETGKPYSKVAVSTNPATKGCFSAEGAKVTVQDSMKMVGSGTVRGATVKSDHYDQLDLIKLNAGTKYTIKVNGVEKTFEGGKTVADTIANMRAQGLDVSEPMGDKRSVYIMSGGDYAELSEVKEPASGVIALKPTSGATYTVDLDSINDGQEYSLKVVYGDRVKIINFVGSANKDETIANIQGALTKEFGMTGVHSKLLIDEDGNITSYDGNPLAVTSMLNGTKNDAAVAQRDVIYSNNYIQLTLDAARALREGDIDYANGCIDRIVAANEHLLMQIADLGSNEEFIDFNTDRLITRELNLAERQNDLEVTDAEKEITLWKTYEALYNACLQMSSSVIPNSIFNYIR